jgi:hypothetical protein
MRETHDKIRALLGNAQFLAAKAEEPERKRLVEEADTLLWYGDRLLGLRAKLGPIFNTILLSSLGNAKLALSSDLYPAGGV